MGIQSDMSKGAFDPLVRPRPDGLQLRYSLIHMLIPELTYLTVNCSAINSLIVCTIRKSIQFRVPTDQQ